MAGLTWLHLSDWHQHGSEFVREKVLDKLTKDIHERVKIHRTLADLDFIAFTGDLAYHGTEEEYRVAYDTFLKPLLEAANVEASRLFIVPGNHDLNWTRLLHLPPTLSGIPDSEEGINQWLANDADRTGLLNPMAPYSDFMKEHFANYIRSDEPAYGYLYCFRTAATSVSILGLNSAWLSGRNLSDGVHPDDRGHLALGEPQYYHLLRDSTDSQVRVALLHHPLEWLMEFDWRHAEANLGEACHFLLRGHEHHPQVRAVHGTAGSYLIIPAGASYNRPPSADMTYAHSYNFVHLDPNSRQGIVYLRKWSARRGRWVPDIDTWDDGEFPFSLPDEDHGRSARHTSPHLGRVPRSPGHLPAGVASFVVATTHAPSHSSALFRRGRVHLLQGLHAQALADLTKAAELEPDNAHVIATLGQAYRMAERYADAVTHLAQAIDMDPDVAWFYAERGEAYRLTGRLEDALADLNVALTLDPGCASAVASRAFLHLSLKHCGNALADFKLAARLVPDDAHVLAGRGETYRLLGRVEDAIRDLTQAISLDTAPAWFYLSRGLAHRSRSQYDDALHDFTRAIELDPHNPFAFVSRGETHELNGQYSEAVADFDRAIDLEPRYIAAVGSVMRMPGALPPVAHSTRP